MAKYHIQKSGKNAGQPAKCHAEINCPNGGEHFGSQEDAIAHIEEMNATEAGGSFGSSLDNTNKDKANTENNLPEYQRESLGRPIINSTFKVNPNDPTTVQRSNLNKKIIYAEKDIKRLEREHDHAVYNGDTDRQHRQMEYERAKQIAQEVQEKREEKESLEKQRNETFSDTEYKELPKKKFDREFARIRSDWKARGMRGLKDLSEEEQRIVDRSLTITNSDRYRDGDKFYGAGTDLIEYRPTIANSKYASVATALRFDHETGNIYQVDMYSQAAGRFFGKGGRANVYKVTNHGNNLTGALEAAKAENDQNIGHYKKVNNVKDIEFTEPQSQFEGYVPDRYIRNVSSDPFKENEDLIKTNLAKGLKSRKALLIKWEEENKNAEEVDKEFK